MSVEENTIPPPPIEDAQVDLKKDSELAKEQEQQDFMASAALAQPPAQDEQEVPEPQTEASAVDPEIFRESEGLPTPKPEENSVSTAPVTAPIPAAEVPTEPSSTAIASDAAAEPTAEVNGNGESLKRERESDEGTSINISDAPAAETTEPDAKKPKTESADVPPPAAPAPEAPSLGPDPLIKPTTPAPKPPVEPDMNNLPETPLPKHQAKHALTSIKAVRRLKDAGPFLQPVDIVKNNIPFYYNYIQRPMDLSTMEKKINVNAYATPEEVIEDFNLMVNNCVKFNGKDSAIAQMARNVQANFEKHMLNMPPKDAPPGETGLKGRRKTNTDVTASGVPRIRRESAVVDGRPKREIHPPKSKDITYENKPRKKKFIPELRFCGQVLKELMSKKHESISYPFIVPVDPVALGCPTYFDIIKKPMDLGTIQSKLTNNEYENADEFEVDVRLVFHNAYTFNPPSTPVNMMAHRLEGIFDKKWVDKPATPPSPQVQSEEESESEEEEEDIKIDQSLLTNPAIEYLEQQIERMRKDLDKMKKDLFDQVKQERASKRKTSKKGGKRGGARAKKSSASNGYVTGPITFEMKQELSNKLGDLSDEDTDAVVRIIQSTMNSLPVSEDGEMELELDSLDQETITKLYNFVFKKKKRGPGRGASSGVMKNRRDKKLAGAQAEAQRLDLLKSQLKKYDSNNNESSSDDDDESEESSEEE